MKLKFTIVLAKFHDKKYMMNGLGAGLPFPWTDKYRN